MARHTTAVWVAITCQLMQAALACVYLYGARHEVPHYSYGYVGLDWPEEYTTCTGTRQSPIHIPGHSGFAMVPNGEESQFDYGVVSSDGTNIRVVNNGHTVQVVFPTGFAPNASVVARGDNSTAKLVTKFNTTSTTTQRVKLSPAQFHFHTRSEHVIDGKEYAMEMHIVNWVYAPTLPGCGTGGCATVVGIMFELAEDPEEASNEFLNTIWDVMPTTESTTAYIPSGKTLDFDAILPADHSYVTFEGSLTTPPCTEGILWHVLTTPMKITRAQLHKFELAVGATNCTTGGAARHLLSTHSTGGAAASSEAFEVPAFVADSQDGQLCRKLSGQNYREVQDRNSRPILFHAAPGLCEAQLNILQSRSKVLRKLVFEANSTDSITLHQYDDMVEAGLTQEAGCGGIGSSAGSVKGPGTTLLAATALLLLWLL